MKIVTQKARHPWIVFSLAFSSLAALVSVLIGYYNWPPQFSFDWIVGTLVTVGFLLGSVIYCLRLIQNGKYSFEMNEKEIIIRDWGHIRQRVRVFPASSVKEIYHSSNGSGLITTDGKTHYIDDCLMLKYNEIFEKIQSTYSHVSTTNI